MLQSKPPIRNKNDDRWVRINKEKATAFLEHLTNVFRN